MAWQIMDMKVPLSDNIKAALDYHQKKYGAPPNIVEYSDKIIDMPRIDGIKYVPVRIPANILLIGVQK